MALKHDDASHLAGAREVIEHASHACFSIVLIQKNVNTGLERTPFFFSAGIIRHISKFE